MRWLVCLSLLLPVSAHAASVLLVPVDDKARTLAEDLVDAFNANKLTVKTANVGTPAVKCLEDAARDACLQLVGEKAKVIAVFVVSGALKGAKGTLTLELVDEGKLLKKETTKIQKGRVKQQMRAPIARLLKLLPKKETSGPADVAPKATVTETPREAEKPVVVVADVPPPVESTPAPVLTPKEPPRTDPMTVTAPAPVQKKSKAGAVVMTIVAVAAAGTAATFGGLGLAGKSRLETAPNGMSPLTYPEATALQQTANRDLTIALGAGIGAGVSGVVAGILWGVE